MASGVVRMTCEPQKLKNALRRSVKEFARLPCVFAFVAGFANELFSLPLIELGVKQAGETGVFPTSGLHVFFGSLRYRSLGEIEQK